MTTEPKLLSEAELRNITAGCQYYSVDLLVDALRERGLIAPELVDPLLEEAETLHQEFVRGEHGDTIDVLIAALRRGMELGRAERTLTREMVREAVAGAWSTSWSYGTRMKIADKIHAALTGAA